MVKNLILCFDGTENHFQSNPNSNVLKIFRMLEKEKTENQMCYYQRKF